MHHRLVSLMCLFFQVIYIMAGIGYQHSYIEKYFRIVEKAELSGNPLLDHFPTGPEDLTQDSKHTKRLVEYGVIQEGANNADIAKAVCTINLLHSYFKQGSLNDLQHRQLTTRGLKLA